MLGDNSTRNYNSNIHAALVFGDLEIIQIIQIVIRVIRAIRVQVLLQCEQ